MRQRIAVITGLLMLAISCVRNYEIDFETPSKIVVYSVLEAGKKPRVFLYRNIPFEFDLSKRPYEFISDASVYLVANGERIKLQVEQNYDKNIFYGLYSPGEVYEDSVLVTFYTAEHIVAANTVYELEADYYGEKLTASTTVPDSIIAFNASPVIDTVRDKEGQVYRRNLLELRFRDMPVKENYYKYRVSYKQNAFVTDEYGNGFYKIFRYNFLRRSYFSDAGNDGREFTIRFLLDDKLNNFGDTSYVFELNTSVISYSKDLIDFNVSYVNQGNNHVDILDPFTEPVIIKSNIKGGLGIFTSLYETPVKKIYYKHRNL